MFFQFARASHAELMWVLSCYTYTGELSRMTSLKKKKAASYRQRHAGCIPTRC